MSELLDDEALRVINVIVEIDGLDYTISVLDYEISKASLGERPNLQEQFSRLRTESNGHVNALKAEGIEIDWDGPSIFVKKDGNPYLKRDMFNSGEWEPWTYQLPLIGREEEQDRAMRYLDESNRQR